MTPEERKAHKRAVDKAWRDRNRERRLAQGRAYYQAHKAEMYAKQRARVKARAEAEAAYHHAYYEANKERIRAQKREWQLANRERLRARARERYYADLATNRETMRVNTVYVAGEKLWLPSIPPELRDLAVLVREARRAVRQKKGEQTT